MATPYHECESRTDRLSRKISTKCVSTRDDRYGLAFGDDIVEFHEKRFDRAGRRRGHRYLHLHRFDNCNVIAIRDASSNLHGNRTHASCNLGDDLNIWHANRLFVVVAKCLR